MLTLSGCVVCGAGRGDVAGPAGHGGHDDGARDPSGHHAPHGVPPPVAVEVPLDDPAVRRPGRIRLVSTFTSFLLSSKLTSRDAVLWISSTKLDAEKRLALQQEKEALDLKLLEV